MTYTSLTRRHVLTCLGILFLNLPNGIPWLYGNLITYISSYIMARRGTDGFDLNPTWPLTLYSITYSVGLATPGLLVKWLGLRMTTVCIVLFLDLAIFISYFTSQYSIGMLALTLGVLGGLAIGGVACVSLYYMCGWFPQHIGRACAFSSCSVSGGSIFTNILLTVYINPDNLQPDVITSTASYFSQDDLLDRVPRVFLVFGAMSTATHLLGCLLLQPPPAYDRLSMERKSSEPHASSELVDINSQDSKYPIANCAQKLYTTDNGNADSKPPSTYSEQEHCSPHNDYPVSHVNNTNGLCSPQSSDPLSPVLHLEDVLPLQVLQDRNFYLLWFAVGVFMYGLLMVSNFYKQYGQSLVFDDNFFALVASLISLGSIGGRLLSGYILDKFDLKDNIIIYLALNTILCIFWFHSLHLHRVLYLIFSVLLISECNMAFVLAPYAALKLYGATNLSVNTSLIFSSNVVVSLLMPIISPSVLGRFGWFWLFQTDAISSFLVFVSVIVFLRVKPRAK
ncbi:unnamed protein product [Candidula unifasciata]|uniref:Major facilitator superfamily (MFS) profile domain-containing protein n=1 Tax=Candidula unifasciata TaxID=100452 RepID=A0A8S3Z2Z0_9EUPU|nr:unnamed protein product [Candidula unifasciata]